jgi:hypothetical protein
MPIHSEGGSVVGRRLGGANNKCCSECLAHRNLRPENQELRLKAFRRLSVWSLQIYTPFGIQFADSNHAICRKLAKGVEVYFNGRFAYLKNKETFLELLTLNNDRRANTLLVSKIGLAEILLQPQG